jgi:hypothetical protein
MTQSVTEYLKQLKWVMLILLFCNFDTLLIIYGEGQAVTGMA